MMAQAAGVLGAVVADQRGWRQREVKGNQQIGDGKDGDWEHWRRSAIKTSPAKRVSSTPFMRQLFQARVKQESEGCPDSSINELSF
jgi:hypothetical protein